MTSGNIQIHCAKRFAKVAYCKILSWRFHNSADPTKKSYVLDTIPSKTM